MAFTIFMAFTISVVIFGLGFVFLTLRHHYLKNKIKEEPK